MIKTTIKVTSILDMLTLIKTPVYKLKNTGETRTSPALIEQMFSPIPEDEWIQGGKYLDPGCGRGTVLLKMIDRLLPYHSVSNIKNMIMGIDINAHCVYATKEVIARRLNIPSSDLDSCIIQGDFTTWTNSMDLKFKLIAGNPPFQEGGRDDEANKLWPHFIKKASELVDDNGYVVMISPTNWMQPTADIGKGDGANAVNIFNDIFKKNNLILANIDSDSLQKTYFPGVGSTFSYFILQKAAYSGITEFITPTGSIQLNIQDIRSLPKVTSSLSLSLTKKMKGTPFNFQDQNHGLNGHEQALKDGIHKYRAYHTNKKGGTYWFADTKGNFNDSPKVIISLSGKYLAVVNSKDGFTNMCMALICETKDEAEQAGNILNSKLYRFWVEMQKFSGFNPRKLILTLPALDLTKVWDNKLIYKHFKLTKEEIAYLEGMFDATE